MSTRQAGRIVRTPLLLPIAVLAAAWAGPAGGLPAPPSVDTAPPEAVASPSIADTQDAGADQRIAQRIRDIFREIPALGRVGVAVDNGVVSLSGIATSQDDIARAEAIASRVSGVVTVENAVERDLSLGAGAGAIGSLSERFADFVRFLPLLGAAVLVAGLIAALGYLLAGFTAFWRRITPNGFLAELVASAIRFVFIVGGLVIALDMIGAGALLGAVLGGAGVVGIALGFAMRDTIENYVASLVLSLRQPFRANDWVVIDTFEGRVVRLTSRATILITLDGNHLRIPNGQVFKAVILNYTRNPQRRFDFDLGIDADDDPEAGRAVGRRALAALPFVLKDPAPEVRIVEVGDSNIVLKFLGWIDQGEADWFKARSGAIAAVKKALEDAGFAIPEPIYRLRFDGRSDPVPFAKVEDKAPAGDQEPETRRTSAPMAIGPAAAHDVAPKDEIAEMVVAERRNDGGQQADLLDHSRPVE